MSGAGMNSWSHLRNIQVAVSKPLPERGTVPFFLADSQKLGQSPAVLKHLVAKRDE
jgi:hypothetical protein